MAPPFFTSALDGCEWPASRFGCFTPKKEPIVTIGYETGWSWFGNIPEKS
jgi:hypothetical protein